MRNDRALLTCPTARPAPQALALRSPGASQDSGDEGDDTRPLLTDDDFGHTRARALEAVEVPPSVLQLIADLRAYLQVCGRVWVGGYGLGSCQGLGR